MIFHALGLNSDVLVMRGRSTFEQHPDRIIMRTPDEPTYWHGNLIVLKNPPVDPLANARVALIAILS